ncbi:opsin 6, group member a [Alosa sapidissima]|uniref:opsin 6, group member a n=1 Tax=Alosa sapidissima TaxID=34773 RepID=UPI001C094E5D|nr:opsin 6, group member a [Alosa sapidissima]
MSIRIPPQVVDIPWRNNNFSLMSRDPPLSDQGETIIGVYLLILGWLSWFGNSVVIFVLFRQRYSLQPTDYLTLNLAISDASISVFGYSRGIIEIFNVFQDGGFLITSVWTCQVDGFCTLLFGLGSINTLTVISITRYIKGCHPSKAHCITNTTVAMAVMFIWMGSCFWSAAPLLGWGSYTDRGYGTCEVDWAKANYSTIHKSYIITILIFCFFIPVMIMLFSYVSIIKTVKRGNAMASEGDITDRQRKIERDVTIVSIVICTAFILAWSPYAVVSMWSAWGFHVPSLTSIFTRLFAKSASFYNPLIYFGLSAKFRKDVAILLPCAGESKDTVKLKRFKNLKGKQEGGGGGQHRRREQGERGEARPPAQKKDEKGESPYLTPSPDSGVGSTPRTPPQAVEDPPVFVIDFPHSESPGYEIDRL